MSVAFRRESDDEHKEPEFEVPIAPGPNLVTTRGRALIAARVAELDAAIAARGSDEAVKALRRDQRYWATRLSTAEVVPPPPPDEVAIGSTVTFRQDGVEREVAIVGGDEADPAAGRIAFSAPLARALIGGFVGERIDFAGKVEALTITAIGVQP